MLGAISGIINFNKIPIDKKRTNGISQILGNNNATRKTLIVKPWVHFCEISLHGKLINRPTRILSNKVVSDSKIVNKKELAKLLSLENYGKIEDNDFIYAAYNKWGRSCVNYLEGLYSFAIWDESSDSFFCARDPMGKRPFFYTFEKGVFIFGSELKCILSSAKENLKFNYNFLAKFIENIKEEDENTTYLQSVFRLPAGSAMCIEKGQIKLWKYWEIKPIQKLKFKKPDEYIELIQHTSENILNGYFKDKERIGFWMNGNKESAYLLSELHRIFPDKELIAASYLLGNEYRGQSRDDNKWIKLLKEQFPFKLFSVNETIYPKGFDDIVEFRLSANDTPAANPLASDYDILFNVLREQNVLEIIPCCFFNPFHFYGGSYLREIILSGHFLEYLKLLNKHTDRMGVLHKTAKWLFPVFGYKALKLFLKSKDSPINRFRLVRAPFLQNNNIIQKHAINSTKGYHPFFHIQKDLLHHLKKGTSLQMQIMKPITSLERRYDTGWITVFNDRRLIDLSLSIPTIQYYGSSQFPPIFDRLLYKNKVPPPLILRTDKNPWPPDLKDRRLAVQKELFANFSTISKKDIIWELVDYDQAQAMFEYVKNSKSYLIYRQFFLKLTRIIILSRFLKWIEKNYKVSF